MAARFDSIELVVTDMEASLGFYRRLGMSIPEDAASEGHVAVELPGGVRIQFDTEEIMQSFSDWTPPQRGGGHRIALAFACDSPTDVDTVYAQLVESGAPSHLRANGRLLGTKVRHGARSRRQLGRPLRLTRGHGTAGLEGGDLPVSWIAKTAYPPFPPLPKMPFDLGNASQGDSLFPPCSQVFVDSLWTPDRQQNTAASEADTYRVRGLASRPSSVRGNRL